MASTSSPQTSAQVIETAPDAPSSLGPGSSKPPWQDIGKSATELDKVAAKNLDELSSKATRIVAGAPKAVHVVCSEENKNLGQSLAHGMQGKANSHENMQNSHLSLKKGRHLLPMRKYTESFEDPKSDSFGANDPTLENFLLKLRSKMNGQLEQYIEEALKSISGQGDQTTPLHVVIRFRDANLSKDLVKMIVNKTDLVIVVDSQLNAPLHFAVELGRLFLVKYLLSHGADVSHANSRGQTALHDRFFVPLSSYLLRDLPTRTSLAFYSTVSTRILLGKPLSSSL